MRISALALTAGLMSACSASAPAPRSVARTASPVLTAAPPIATSTDSVWGIDSKAPRLADAGPAPTPRDRIPSRRAPCFPHRDVIEASLVFRDLEAYSLYMGADTNPPPRRHYGTCIVEAGKLTDARGTLVADIHCGLTVHVPGIVDDLGFEVGAFGVDVAAALPHTAIMCWSEGTEHARCWAHGDPDVDEEYTMARAHYSFRATVDTEAVDGGYLSGAEARSVFEGNRVASFTQRMYCH